MKNIKKAFTLVELIVVITILAILGTIAFISLQGYSSTARNSKRVSDVVNVGKGLEIKKIKSGFYEYPENYETFTGILSKTLKQGILGDKVLTNIGVTTNVKDPLSQDNYTYSVYGEGEYYQIAYELENNIFSLNLNILNTINAEDTTKTIKIKGNYEMDPSLPSLVVIPETVTGSGIFDPEVCFILEGGENTFESTSLDCQKKKEMSLKDYDDGLVGYWDMETLTGTLLKDLSGNGNNCIGTGGIVIGGTGGKIGKAIYFDGINDFINCGKFTNKESYTISQFVEINSYPMSVAEINTRYLDYVLRITSNKTINFYAYRDNLAGSSIGSKNIIELNKYYHILATYDSNLPNKQMKLYINGNLSNIRDRIGNINLSNEPMIIGNRRGVLSQPFFNGIIDEVHIYNRTLSEQEIKQQAKIAGF